MTEHHIEESWLFKEEGKKFDGWCAGMMLPGEIFQNVQMQSFAQGSSLVILDYPHSGPAKVQECKSGAPY